MPRLFISRLLEAFFRRKWLYLLALVPFVALGVVTVLNSKPTYRSVGSIQVNRTTVVDDGNPFNGTPAAVTSVQINNLLLTDAFLLSVRQEAEKTGGVPLTPEQLRSSIAAAALGEDLVTVSATTADPGLSGRLANATIVSFPEWLRKTIRDQAASLDDASVKQAIDAISARYQTVDKPTTGLEQPHRQKDAFTLVLFLALGMLVSGAALVVATLLDRSVRYGEEIETHLHVPVLASVPDSRAALKPLVV